MFWVISERNEENTCYDIITVTDTFSVVESLAEPLECYDGPFDTREEATKVRDAADELYGGSEDW